MKKIIALFVLMFAFTFNANAQDISKATELAKLDTQQIAQYLEIQGDAILTDLQALFKEKHQILTIEGLSEDRKVILYKFVELKLENILTEDQLSKLKFDTKLYKKLTQN